MDIHAVKEKAESLKTVESINATSAILTAASFFIGQQCKQQNDEFMKCKKDLADPEKCLAKGIQVSKCVKNM